MPAIGTPRRGSDAISCSSGSGGGGTGIGLRVVDVVGEADLDAAVRRSADRVPDDRRRLGGQVEVVLGEVERRCAPSRNSATTLATSAGCWPPSVRVRISMRSFIDRLAAARIGQTATSTVTGAPALPSDATGSRRISTLAAGARILLVGEAPGYRGARISGIPFTSERQLTGSGPAEATATIVHRVLAELGVEDDVLLWNVVPTHPGTDASNRAPTRAEIRGARRSPTSLRAGGGCVAVGRVAHGALGGAYVRHPSHGGATAFTAALQL